MKIIRNCKSCGYIANDFLEGIKYWQCNNELAIPPKGMTKIIQNIDIIPNWCPLEDYKEDKKVLNKDEKLLKIIFSGKLSKLRK